MLYLNSNSPDFSKIELSNNQESLVAYGGKISAESILNAYMNGIFPWYNPGEEILWWSPEPRFILYPEELKISKSMKKILNNNMFHFTENICFNTVINNCKNINRSTQDGTWISDEIIDSFNSLHKNGLAISIEVWQNEILVGGFYGLRIGKVFCGESMFSKVSNASKAGFIYFVEKYKSFYKLIDCQVYTDHLASLGAKMISRENYINTLKKHL